MYWDVNGQDTTKNFFFENEYASEYESFISRTPAAFNVRAMEDSELLELSYANVQKLYETFPVWQKYGRIIAEWLFIHLSRRSKDLLSKSPEELYVDLLNTRPYIIERMPLHYIASYLGVQPESLSRIRKRLMEVQRSA
jgi:CRP-like cAMP-binding protein